MPEENKTQSRRRYCDDCQLPIEECSPTCEGYIEREYREYMRAMRDWEMSPDWVETNPY
jgi:hypothetical protein